MNLPAVVGGSHAIHQAPSFHPVEESHGAVVADEKPFRQFAYSGSQRLIGRANRQHQLMLLGFQFLSLGGFFTEMQESSQLIAELSQRLIVFGREIIFSHP
jgi:hypothetical protein